MITFTFELARSSKKAKALRNGNEMISSNDRLHYRVKSELAAHLRALSRDQAIHNAPLSGYEPFSKNRPCRVGIRVYPPTRRRMDTPNWYPTVKPLIDGLTDAGVFTDDNNTVITSMTFIPGNEISGTKKYRIEILIQEGMDEVWQTCR